MKKTIIAAIVGLSAASLQAQTYEFDVTLKGYEGESSSSVSYGGQVARHALHNSLKVITKKPNAEKMQAYFSDSEAGREILDPVSKEGFAIKQTKIDQLSSGKNLASSAYKGVVTGWPGNLTGKEVLEQMVANAANTKGGYDPVNGYDYIQLISKFTMGAVFYNKAVNHYLDELLAADVKPNNKAYKDGVAYTGKEHVWDEAFGYFGAPAHSMNLTPKEVVQITKRNPDYFSKADANGDGVVDLKSEMAFAHAYYAASIDASGGTTYFHSIVKAFLDGRQLISDANGEALSSSEREALKGYASVIATAWQQVIAEAAFKYAGSVYADLEKIAIIEESHGDVKKAYRTYVKHWGELKGFALALEAAGRELGEAQPQLDRLIGFSPVLFGDAQVIASNGQGGYIQSNTIKMQEYKVNMIKVQSLLASKFNLSAKLKDKTAGLDNVLNQLNTGPSAEND
ncbi:DUF4856 domain-containing protein [Marinomonas mediterranea]|jgi:hypothetical protein|uniref:DUF4856 domain-containing protein n=1 Tax=Marinomonas mediterranea (strain ATCC 700492 / JCM 21426 / NBRC 103028 / MMB-1) TaxID=717774 RepID=F2K1Y9_MARM1|nr:DUF4856 domain-containing protein [Marinomonas mediterranea]ADZ89983.1 hypothetical protein Marme_0700 [Marinomonas mediterranea MMB-1]WCN08050.1 DUF4856 domain-containing protein [Marinomonas mediterranea]WCN12145.1 DUF4856 domain-containing protein [Marinomonas mediterranea]WCN16192.1 DUF4856 domain-containing protein [Marinomonas mediterranea MMB-1]